MTKHTYFAPVDFELVRYVANLRTVPKDALTKDKAFYAPIRLYGTNGIYGAHIIVNFRNNWVYWHILEYEIESFRTNNRKK